MHRWHQEREGPRCEIRPPQFPDYASTGRGQSAAKQGGKPDEHGGQLQRVPPHHFETAAPERSYGGGGIMGGRASAKCRVLLATWLRRRPAPHIYGGRPHETSTCGS